MSATMFAQNTRRLEELRKRAKRLGLKIDFVSAAPWVNRKDEYYGIGSSRIRDFNLHCDRYEGDNCKVACLNSLDEIEAFILSREMMK